MDPKTLFSLSRLRPFEGLALTAQDLAGDLGALPPMKIHCGQLVEGALRNALDQSTPAVSNSAPSKASTLSEDMHRKPGGKIRIVPLD